MKNLQSDEHGIKARQLLLAEPPRQGSGERLDVVVSPVVREQTLKKKIVYTQADGNLAIVHPVINAYPKREDITEDEAVKRAWDRLPIDAINPVIIDGDAIPADRSFRNAWARDGVAIVHDMEKARDIHRGRLRAARAPLLAELDVAYQRADETQDAAEKTKIAARKQVLRDITKHPDIERARTVDDLKLITVS